ncbi:M20/M25/M40 family metallo-hydrolase [Halpernia frigidisoli]|uniref:Peptidase family M28 n=1 Tax=Halpernia frigidisoli TaxID=1125876 RepID=A0A1I3DVL1_9FLAO|nr:M20/M25/M40 family metallo-hydrolase [Halpernia frigidisoli]SFH90772.1 Peptidase family M28 [Halpernia frigidisoli]
MKKYIIFLLITGSLSAQTTINRDPEISEYVNLISSDSLKAHVEKLVSFGTRQTTGSTTDKKRGIGAARNWVLSQFKNDAKNSGGRMTVELQTEDLQPDGKRITKAINLGNPTAILKGTDPSDNRVFIISGHLDSRVSDVLNIKDDAPGANDDASGVAAVLECARILSKSNFPATIVFVAFSGEEQGLYGSAMLAKRALNEKWNVVAMLNNDMIGNNEAVDIRNISNMQLRVFSEGLPFLDLDKKAKFIRAYGLENDGEPRQLARYTKEIGERYVDNLEVKLIYRNDRFLRGGDHTPFVEAGFPAVRLTDMNENFNHQHQDLRIENKIEYGDLVKFMDFEYLRKNTAVNMAVLANLSKAPSKPENVKMDVKDLTNFTNLSWEKPASGKVSGFYILLRETDQSMWQKKIFTRQNPYKLPYSKDNYFFAVQSVSENGNESIPVVPMVGR